MQRPPRVMASVRFALTLGFLYICLLYTFIYAGAIALKCDLATTLARLPSGQQVRKVEPEHFVTTCLQYYYLLIIVYTLWQDAVYSLIWKLSIANLAFLIKNPHFV